MRTPPTAHALWWRLVELQLVLMALSGRLREPALPRLPAPAGSAPRVLDVPAAAAPPLLAGTPDDWLVAYI